MFVEFASVEEACRTRRALNGRKFSNRKVEINYMSEKHYASRDYTSLWPNDLPSHSTTYNRDLASHVAALVKQIEEAEKAARLSARIAATAAANASFGGQFILPPPPMPALPNVAKPDFDEDVSKDEEAMEEDD